MTNKTDENFYLGRLYRILFYNFFLGLYDLHDQGNNRPLDGIQKLPVVSPSVTPMDTGFKAERACWGKIFQMGEIEYGWLNRDVSEKVVAEFLAKVYHPRIRSKSHFVHRRESPGFASILLVLPVLNVG